MLSKLPCLLGRFLVVPAVLAGICTADRTWAQDGELGRLFFTLQQRQDLDRRRASNAQAAAVTATTEDLVTINGRVARSSGKTTTWINGIPQEDANHGPDASKVTIPPTEDSPSVSLRVGETLDRVKNETRNPLGGGLISVPPPSKK